MKHLYKGDREKNPISRLLRHIKRKVNTAVNKKAPKRYNYPLNAVKTRKLLFSMKILKLMIIV